MLADYSGKEAENPKFALGKKKCYNSVMSKTNLRNLCLLVFPVISGRVCFKRL